MDNLILEYRDPLFGIIYSSFDFSNFFYYYSFSIYKERKARKDYRNYLLRFELGKLKEEDYVHFTKHIIYLLILFYY